MTRERVFEATSAVTPALEIIDSRIRDWKIRIQDTVADNASSAFFVLGPALEDFSALDLELVGMKMTKNGRIVSTGAGAACLGHPADAVAWLAEAMSGFGAPLKAGETILSGSLGPVINVAAGDRIVATLRGIGAVSCAFS